MPDSPYLALSLAETQGVRQIVGENVWRMGVDRANVSGLELGQRNPTVAVVSGAGAILMCFPEFRQ
jgi:hypothetical protein